jgi:hypothetical protein
MKNDACVHIIVSTGCEKSITSFSTQLYIEIVDLRQSLKSQSIALL